MATGGERRRVVDVNADANADAVVVVILDMVNMIVCWCDELQACWRGKKKRCWNYGGRCRSSGMLSVKEQCPGPPLHDPAGRLGGTSTYSALGWQRRGPGQPLDPSAPSVWLILGLVGLFAQK